MDYGTSAASLNQTTNDAALVTSHSVTLNGPDAGHGLLLPGPLDRRGHQRGDLAGGGQPARDASPRPAQNLPAITRVVATPGTDGATATITWTTDVASDSRVDYGTAPGIVDLAGEQHSARHIAL